jgi:hypothetical protein
VPCNEILHPQFINPTHSRNRQKVRAKIRATNELDPPARESYGPSPTFCVALLIRSKVGAKVPETHNALQLTIVSTVKEFTANRCPTF